MSDIKWQYGGRFAEKADDAVAFAEEKFREV
jgi:hypothetical protein